MTTYIETVPVSEVPFPAVTLSAEHPVRPQGLMGHILDRFCFDRAGRSSYLGFETSIFENQCTGNSTDRLRRDFQAIIEQVKWWVEGKSGGIKVFLTFQAARVSYKAARNYLNDNPKYFQEVLRDTLHFDDVNGTLPLLSFDYLIKSQLESISYFLVQNKVFQNQVETEFRMHQFDLVDQVERVWELELEESQAMDPPEKDLMVSLLGIYDISLAGAMHITSLYMGQGEQVIYSKTCSADYGVFHYIM